MAGYSPNEERHPAAFVSEIQDLREVHGSSPLCSSVLHELFTAQVAATPDSVAIKFEDETLTYRQLDERANQLAHHLKKRGAGAEMIVALALERSVAMVVALLGILKTGGSYLPLDLSYPADRITFMLQHAGVNLLLTQQQLLDRLPAGDLDVLCVDLEFEEIDREPTSTPAHDASADSLAYVIYTSGSTGRPKGVMVTHRGLANYLTWCVSAYGVSEAGRSPVHSPIGFDLTVTSLFAPLVCGGSVRLVREGTGIETLGAALEERRDFGLLKITPAPVGSLGRMVLGDGPLTVRRALVRRGEA